MLLSIPMILTLPQYSHQFRVGTHESWNEKFYSLFVSDPDFYAGPGSPPYEQMKFYTKHYWEITVHTIAGSLWLFCGLIQFNNYIRKHYIKIHRITGYGYFIALTMSLIGSGPMLVFHVTESKMDGDALIYTKSCAAHLFGTLYWGAGVLTGLIYEHLTINSHVRYFLCTPLQVLADFMQSLVVADGVGGLVLSEEQK